MSDANLFSHTSARFGLPLLFSGQAQKEVFVNEAFALVDTLLHCLIEGEIATPPEAPVDGSAWLIGAGASGDWTGRTGLLACRQAGNWLHVMPQDGMRIIDRSTGQVRVYLGGWKKAISPVEPNGGSVVDSQARAAIHDLIAALRSVCILPSI